MKPRIFSSNRKATHMPQIPPAEGKAEKVSHTYSYTPLHHQPYVEGVVDISCRTKGVGGEDVDGAAYFEEYIYDKDGGTHTYDVGVDVSQPKMACPERARMQDSMTVIMTDFFMTYFPIRKAA